MKTTFFALIAGMFCWSVIAQTADEWVSQGLSALSVQDLNDANNDFASALAVSSTNEDANALYAITRLLVLSSQPAGSNFLTRIGIPVDGRNIYDWTADPPEDTNGVPLAPSGVNADEFTAQVRTNVLNAVIGAVGNLSEITDTNFTIDLTSNETSVAAVTVDYGDLELIQAGLYAAEYGIYTANAQNVNAELTDIRALYTNGNFTAQNILSNYPELFTFATTNDLQAACAAFTNAVNTYLVASSFIRARPTNEVRLFNYDQVSATNEATFRSVIQDLENSLAGARVLSAYPSVTVDMATQFTGATTWRSLLPTFDGNIIDTGSFQDPIAVPDPTFGGLVGGLTQSEVETFFDEHYRILQSFGLVENGGFETRDFTDWTLFGSDTNDMLVDNGSYTGYPPYSGNYAAALGPVGPLSYLSQTLPTTAGITYSLSFWLENPYPIYPGSSNEFLVSWNGNTLFDQKNMPSFGWTNLQFSVAATGASTVLEFGTLNDDWFLLDDVSVLPPPAALGATELVEGPTATNDSIVLGTPSTNYPWTASANAEWLHINATNQSGVGSANVIFSVDANPGDTRTGTLTIAGLTATITQGGSTYVEAPGSLTTLVSSGLKSPNGVAVDASGNVYIADTGNNVIKEWTKAGNNVTTIVSSNSLNGAEGVAVDAAGNVYIADEGDAAIKKWIAASNSLVTLPIAGLSSPLSVAVDTAGNIYIADDGTNISGKDGAIKEWIVASNTISNLVSGLLEPQGVAVDRAGNVYFVSFFSGGLGRLPTANVTEWSAASGNQITLAAAQSSFTGSLAVDGSGDVYIADRSEIVEIPAVRSASPITIVSGISSYGAIDAAVDPDRNLYVADYISNAVRELPRAFVDPTQKLEGLSAGSDALPEVLPTTANLLPPFSPAADQSWLSIPGAFYGVVDFSFTADTGPARTAHIVVLGETNTITQGNVGVPAALSRVQMAPNGSLQFAFTNVPSGAFTVLSTTNPSQPLINWTVLGAPVESPAGQYQFIDTRPFSAQSFYTVRSP